MHHTCAVYEGKVGCWGRNEYGQVDVPDGQVEVDGNIQNSADKVGDSGTSEDKCIVDNAGEGMVKGNVDGNEIESVNEDGIEIDQVDNKISTQEGERMIENNVKIEDKIEKSTIDFQL